MASLNVWTDGSCLAKLRDENQGGQAGYGFVIDHERKTYTDSGTIVAASNGAELIAMIKAIEFVVAHQLHDGYEDIVIHTDSKYVVGGVTKWIELWKSRDWRRVDKRKNKTEGIHIAYMEEWKRLDHLLAHYPVKVQWVPGHSGIEQNEMANKLAKKAAMKGR